MDDEWWLDGSGGDDDDDDFSSDYSESDTEDSSSDEDSSDDEGTSNLNPFLRRYSVKITANSKGGGNKRSSRLSGMFGTPIQPLSSIADTLEDIVDVDDSLSASLAALEEAQSELLSLDPLPPPTEFADAENDNYVFDPNDFTDLPEQDGDLEINPFLIGVNPDETDITDVAESTDDDDGFNPFLDGIDDEDDADAAAVVNVLSQLPFFDFDSSQPSDVTGNATGTKPSRKPQEVPEIKVDLVTAAQDIPDSAPALSRTLSDAAATGRIAPKDALSAAWWIDKQFRLLIKAIKSFGSKQGSRYSVTFGTLFNHTGHVFDPFLGILESAKEQGVVLYSQAKLNIDGRDDAVVITLMKESIDDSSDSTYTLRQLRQCSIRKKQPQNSIRRQPTFVRSSKRRSVGQRSVRKSSKRKDASMRRSTRKNAEPQSRADDVVDLLATLATHPVIKPAADPPTPDRSKKPVNLLNTVADIKTNNPVLKTKLADAIKFGAKKSTVLSCVQWMDSQMTELIRSIKEVGREDHTGRPKVTYLSLKLYISEKLEPLSGILQTAQEQGIVLCQPNNLQIAEQGGDVLVTLLKDSIGKSNPATYTYQQIRSCSVVRGVQGGASVRGSKRVPGTNCRVCKRSVYSVEFLGADGMTFHRNCFICHICHTQLRLDTYVIGNNRLYCKTHHTQAVSESSGGVQRQFSKVSRGLQSKVKDGDEKIQDERALRVRAEEEMRRKIKAEDPKRARPRSLALSKSGRRKGRQEDNGPPSASRSRALSRGKSVRGSVRSSQATSVLGVLSATTGSNDKAGLSRKPLRESIRSGVINRKDALKAAWWVDTQMRTLIKSIQHFGKLDSSGHYAVTFGDLSKYAGHLFSPLAGTLMTAKKQKVVTFGPEILFKGTHDNIPITLNRTEIKDATEETYTPQQIRQCSVRRR